MVDALEHSAILRNGRLGEFDALVGINLLWESLDLPEVALVAILDADNEGFLRGEIERTRTCRWRRTSYASRRRRGCGTS